MSISGSEFFKWLNVFGIKPSDQPAKNYRVITGATTLTSADFGKIIICRDSTPTGDYTVTLPPTSTQPNPSTGNDGNIYFIFEQTPLNFITIAPNSGDFIGGGVGVNPYLFGLSESLTITSDGWAGGVNWYPSPNLASVYFTAGLNASVASTTSISTIPWDSNIVASNVNYVSGSGFINPIFPGRYEVTINVTSAGTATSYLQTAAVGTPLIFSNKGQNQVAASVAFQTVGVTGLISVNGKGTSSSGGANTIAGGYASNTSVNYGGFASGTVITVKRLANF